MAENPATHKRLFKKNKNKTKQKQKKTPNLPIGDSPSLQKYANNLDINEAQACGSLSGHESTAKILCMEFMPGLLPLPLGKKGKDKGERGKGSTSGGSGGDTGAPWG